MPIFRCELLVSGRVSFLWRQLLSRDAKNISRFSLDAQVHPRGHLPGFCLWSRSRAEDQRAQLQAHFPLPPPPKKKINRAISGWTSKTSGKVLKRPDGVTFTLHQMSLRLQRPKPSASGHRYASAALASKCPPKLKNHRGEIPR